MNKMLLIIMGLYVPQLFAVDTMTISNLPIATSEDEQVCYDGVTGKLGSCSAAATAKPKRIAWVSKEGGGDYDDPIAAMNDLDNWCASPSNSFPCVLRIGPGIWELGSIPLVMVAGVDIQGSGRGATTLQGDFSSSTGLVAGADFSSLRDIFIINRGSGTFVSAISANNTTSFILDNVGAHTSGSPTSSYGLRIANDIGSSGGTQVQIKESLFEPQSSGTNTGIYIVNETTEFMSVSIKNSSVSTRNNAGTALRVSTTFSTSATQTRVTHSSFDEPVNVSGSGTSIVDIRWTSLTDTIYTSTSGGLTCKFVSWPGGSSIDTCP